MSDFTGSKGTLGAIYPSHAVAAELQRLEPIISPQDIRDLHLFGLTLASQMPDAITQKNRVITDEIIKRIILNAIEQAELDLNIDISPVQRKVKMPFDRNLYQQYGYMVLPNRPVMSIDSFTVTPANGVDIYKVPLDWLEMANSPKGQINIVPMTAAFIQGGSVAAAATGGTYFLSVLNNRGWVPAYWQVTYTSGYPDTMVPRIINELIGTITAMEILSMLATTYARSQSHSLSIDGLSQSVSGPGPTIFKGRLEELDAKRTKLTNKIKALYGRKIFASSI